VAAKARQTSHARIYIHKLTILQKRQTSPGLSLFAGGVAGGVEAATTVSLLDLRKYPLPTNRQLQYPFEFAKTRSQLGSKNPGQTSILHLVRNVLRTEGISGLYTGCSTLVVVSVPTFLAPTAIRGQDCPLIKPS